MQRKWMKFLILFTVVLGLALSFGPLALAADGTDSWRVPTDLTNPQSAGIRESPLTNLGSWFAEQLKYLYVLIVAVVSIIFVVKHQYSRLAAFLIIAIIVAIPIFAPNAIPGIAKSISNAITGSN